MGSVSTPKNSNERPPNLPTIPEEEGSRVLIISPYPKMEMSPKFHAYGINQHFMVLI